METAGGCQPLAASVLSRLTSFSSALPRAEARGGTLKRAPRIVEGQDASKDNNGGQLCLF